MFQKVFDFLRHGIWRLRLKNYPPGKSFLLKQLRVIVLSVRGFVEDQCKFRASALTFFSLLSIVPVLALMFGIAKGFGLQKRVENAILNNLQDFENVEGYEKMAENIISFSNSLLERTSGGLIAGIGVVFLFWTIIKLLGNIENSFNNIWGVKKPRHLGRKFSDYLSVILICPILLVISSSLNVAITTHVKDFIANFDVPNIISALILLSLRLLPFITIWLTFSFVFIFMPNTKVKLKSAFASAVVSGTLFVIAQKLYVIFQVGSAKYSAIYGSFAALPLFLLWLQISWLIVLFGGELSFAYQNVDTYEFEQESLSISYKFKKKLSLLITHLFVMDFCNEKPAKTSSEITHHFEIPIRLVRQIVFELCESGILSEVKKDDETDTAYQPAVSVNKLTIKYVLDALEGHGSADIPMEKTEVLEKLSGCLEDISKQIEKSPANVKLMDI